MIFARLVAQLMAVCPTTPALKKSGGRGSHRDRVVTSGYRNASISAYFSPFLSYLFPWISQFSLLAWIVVHTCTYCNYGVPSISSVNRRYITHYNIIHRYVHMYIDISVKGVEVDGS